MLAPQQIIVRPVVSEKTTGQAATDNKYTFEVHKDANKIAIRNAIEMVFGVRVQSVRTQVVRGSMRRVGRHYGMTNSWKKAVITLHGEDSIDLYGEES